MPQKFSPSKPTPHGGYCRAFARQVLRVTTEKMTKLGAREARHEGLVYRVCDCGASDTVDSSALELNFHQNCLLFLHLSIQGVFSH